ncbi:hypothetical protein ASALC70_03535 [Alcanivorax sp. ALC70]|nr:hypothetical protein ASALC70_03535 [Alcanivorax sp. ALC70]
MNVFIIGITGAVGGLLAEQLHARGTGSRAWSAKPPNGTGSTTPAFAPTSAISPP